MDVKLTNLTTNKLKSLIYRYGYDVMLSDAKILIKRGMIRSNNYLYELIKMSKSLSSDNLYNFLLTEDVINIKKEIDLKIIEENKQKYLDNLKSEAFLYITNAYKDIIIPYNNELKEKLIKKFEDGGNGDELSKQYTKEITKYTKSILDPIKYMLIERYPEFKSSIPNWKLYL